MKLFLVRKNTCYYCGVVGVVRAEDEDKAKMVFHSYECCNDYETFEAWLFRMGENYEFMELSAEGKERVLYHFE